MTNFEKLKQPNTRLFLGQRSIDGEWIPDPSQHVINQSGVTIRSEVLNRGIWEDVGVKFTVDSINNPIKVRKNWIQLENTEGKTKIISVFSQPGGLQTELIPLTME